MNWKCKLFGHKFTSNEILLSEPCQRNCCDVIRVVRFKGNIVMNKGTEEAKKLHQDILNGIEIIGE